MERFQGSTFIFYHLFSHLEERGYLDLRSELHLFYLQYAFVPIIHMHLDYFCHGWDFHPLRTKHNNSPRMLWLEGQHVYEVEDFDQEHLETYGIEWDGPTSNTSEGAVVVPRI
eukprot:gene1776-1979_t